MGICTRLLSGTMLCCLILGDPPFPLPQDLYGVPLPLSPEVSPSLYFPVHFPRCPTCNFHALRTGSACFVVCCDVNSLSV